MTQGTGGRSAGAELAGGAIVNTVALLASNLRGIFTFLVARALGQAALGTFSVCWAIVNLLSTVGALGFDSSVGVLIPRREAVGDRAGSRQLFVTAAALAGGMSVLLAILAIVLNQTFGGWLGQPPELVTALSLLALAIPGSTLYSIGTNASRGMKVMRHDILSRGLTLPFVTVAAFIAALMIGLRASAPQVAAVTGATASGIVALLLAASVFRGVADGESSGRGHWGGLAREMMSYSAPIAAYNLLNTVIVQLDIVMLGWFINRVPGVTLATVGIYAAAVDVASGLRKVSQAFNPIFTPIVAAMTATGEQERAMTMYVRLARWMLAILLPLVAVMTLGGGAILAIYGPAFRQGALWLGIVATACATNAFVGLGETVIMVQRPRVNLVNSTFTFAIAVGANLWLIPHYGITGAAVGILLPYVVQGILRSVELRFIFHWRSPWTELARPILAGAVALLPGLGCYMLLGGMAGQLASAAAFLLAYVGAWWMLGLEADDRAILLELTGRRPATRHAA